MFSKHVSQLTYSDIEDLVNIRKEREGYKLDFKGEFGNIDKAKKELAKDVTAFANSSGGFLVFGVDKFYNITGIDKTIQNRDVDEWINQILSSNAEPHVFYYDPKVIEIPKQEKVIVVIHIPESTKKPHIVTEINNYFIRVNDSSKTANHAQIRDMFSSSNKKKEEFEAFLNKRNLLDIESTKFAENKNSAKLYSEVPQKTGFPKPFVLFSLIPQYPNEEKIHLPINELKNWLNQNSKGYEPASSFPLYYVGSDNEQMIDGMLIRHSSSGNLNSYFEVLNSGFVEAGFSQALTYPFTDNQNKSAVAIYLTQIIAYEMMFLGFARKFYELAKYYDEVMLQISFANVLNLKLYGLNTQFSRISMYDRNGFANKQHTNFKLNYLFNPKELFDKDILEIAKIHSEKICRVFGFDKDYCFVNDQLSVSELNQFRYY
jgi:hypothetical protein